MSIKRKPGPRPCKLAYKLPNGKEQCNHKGPHNRGSIFFNKKPATLKQLKKLRQQRAK